MKIDRRIKKTKIALQEAFIKLLNKKNFDEITITDISREADTSRKTFYNHYSNIDDLIDEIEEYILIEFDKLVENYTFEKILQNPMRFFEAMQSVFNEKYHDYFSVLSMHRGYQFIEKVTHKLKAHAKSLFNSVNAHDHTTTEYMATYILGGLTSLYHSFYENNMKGVKDDANYLSNLVMNGINGFVKQ